MDELREQSESDVQQYKQDLEEMYCDKVEQLSTLVNTGYLLVYRFKSLSLRVQVIHKRLHT